MSDTLARELQRLYRAWYANSMSLADYRHQRGLLLDSLLPRDAAADDMITRPRAEQPVLEPTAPPAEPVRPARQRGFRWPYVVAACVVLLAVVVYGVVGTLDAPEPLETERTESLPEEITRTGSELTLPEVPQEPIEEIVTPPDVGQRLVEQFLANDDWRDVSLKDFLESWGRLPASDRIVAKGAVWFAPLSDELEYRIGELREFSNDPNDPRLQHLYEFALAVGLYELAPDGWKPTVQKPKPVAAASEAPIETATSEPEPEPARAENPNACKASQLETRRRGCFDVLTSGESGPAMRVIPAEPQAFAISVFEISRAEFLVYCEQGDVACPEDPWPGQDMPVVNVSFEDALAYCEWLSRETGFTYRLPKDAEWEFAARAGVSTDFILGDELTQGQARFSGEIENDSPLPMADRTTQRNDFGLWHVIGNVREWVIAETTVTRGGSYADDDDQLRFGSRAELESTAGDDRTGFRVLREL
jgi:hypothetical protein